MERFIILYYSTPIETTDNITMAYGMYKGACAMADINADEGIISLYDAKYNEIIKCYSNDDDE